MAVHSTTQTRWTRNHQKSDMSLLWEFWRTFMTLASEYSGTIRTRPAATCPSLDWVRGTLVVKFSCCGLIREQIIVRIECGSSPHTDYCQLSRRQNNRLPIVQGTKNLMMCVGLDWYCWKTLFQTVIALITLSCMMLFFLWVPSAISSFFNVHRQLEGQYWCGRW